MQFRAQHDYYRERFPDAAYNVILCDGRPAAACYVDQSPEEIRIVDIALLPAHCRHGIGATLVGDLQREAAQSRKPLRIHVERFNPALRLYERLGFRLLEDREVYLFLEWKSDGAAPDVS